MKIKFSRGGKPIVALSRCVIISLFPFAPNITGVGGSGNWGQQVAISPCQLSKNQLLQQVVRGKLKLSCSNFLFQEIKKYQLAKNPF